MMTTEQFDCEKAYRVTLAIAKTMLQKGLITEQEYKRINRMMLEKYRPLLGIVWR